MSFCTLRCRRCRKREEDDATAFGACQKPAGGEANSFNVWIEKQRTPECAMSEISHIPINLKDARPGERHDRQPLPISRKIGSGNGEPRWQIDHLHQRLRRIELLEAETVKSRRAHVESLGNDVPIIPEQKQAL